VQDWLTTYLELARQEDWDGDAVPTYVEREFRRFLRRSNHPRWSIGPSREGREILRQRTSRTHQKSHPFR